MPLNAKQPGLRFMDEKISTYAKYEDTALLRNPVANPQRWRSAFACCCSECFRLVTGSFGQQTTFVSTMITSVRLEKHTGVAE